MVNFSKCIIYTIKIRKKIYVGSSANPRKRFMDYENSFNNLINNYNEILNEFDDYKYHAISKFELLRYNYDLRINNSMVRELLIEPKYELKIHHTFNCNNNIELFCEEERTRRAISKYGNCDWLDYENMMNEQVCVSDKLLKEDDARIMRNAGLKDDDIRVIYDKVIRGTKINEKNIYRHYRQFKERNGAILTFGEFNYIWQKKFGDLIIVYKDKQSYERWSWNGIYNYKQITT